VTRLQRSLLAWVVAANAVLLHAAPADDALTPDEQTGGATTVAATGRNAFSFAAANLNDDERTRFAVGNSFFRRNWVEAPSSTAARDGLGPHFIARSCGGCHVQSGRGAPPDYTKPLNANSEPPVALLLRLSIPGEGPHGGPRPDPIYGDQLRTLAVPGVRVEGRVTMQVRTLRGSFADGTRYTLRQPRFGVANLAYGPASKDLMIGPRLAPQLIGMGLLESIPEQEILGNAARQAAAPGPVKGQVNSVWDAFAQRMMPGRFGWKANVATVAHQTAAAFVGDIGITSARFPEESCTFTQDDCRAAPRGAKGEAPEIDDRTLGDVVFYQASLAPPARRAPNDAQVLRGRTLFEQAQCVACHRPSYVTGDSPLPAFASPALKGQTIWPYTDLLVHDMGEGLADGRPDFKASGRHWRTPPLWGVGLIRDVNDHQQLLHDGRARGVLEAVLWHGGEADASRRQVLKMSAAERAALVRFVESL
jgi:CxxC motif-containing protein (DUF1111 family)